MEYFANKPSVLLEADAVIAVFAAYNEALRLPFFLEYYRKHGIGHFFAVDNASTDGTADFLKAQADVSYFWTAANYAESNAGRLWTTELARHYARDRWCLTLDADELFVFPGSEYADIRTLTKYLDEHRYEALFTIFLDMYGHGQLSEALYAPGQDFLDVCDRYEVDTYTLHAPINFPYLQIFGGPRQRMFRQQGNEGSGPSMRKLPLMKWKDGADYIYSTHSCEPCRLADITGATLHFKFFASFKHLAETEAARGARRQLGHYQHYAAAVGESDPCFVNETTRSWSGTLSLVREGAMVSTKRWANFVKSALPRRQGREVANELQEAKRVAEEAATLELKQLPLLWPLFNHDVSFRVLEVRENRIVGAFRETISDAPSSLLILDERGERLAISQPFSADGILGIPERLSRALVVFDLPETTSRSARKVQIVLESSRELLATLIVESRRVSMPRELFGAVMMVGQGSMLRFKFEGERFDLNEADLALYIDGRWRALIPLRHAEERVELLEKRERRFLNLDLSDLVKEGSLVEAYFARRNVRLRRSPLVYSGGSFAPANGRVEDPDQLSAPAYSAIEPLARFQVTR